MNAECSLQLDFTGETGKPSKQFNLTLDGFLKSRITGLVCCIRSHRMTPGQDGFFSNTDKVACVELTNIVRKQIHSYLGKVCDYLSRKLASNDWPPLLFLQLKVAQVPPGFGMVLHKTVFFSSCWFHRGLDLQLPHALCSDYWVAVEHSSGKARCCLASVENTAVLRILQGRKTHSRFQAEVWINPDFC